VTDDVAIVARRTKKRPGSKHVAMLAAPAV